MWLQNYTIIYFDVTIDKLSLCFGIPLFLPVSIIWWARLLLVDNDLLKKRKKNAKQNPEPEKEGTVTPKIPVCFGYLNFL